MNCEYLVSGGLGFIGNELVRQLIGSPTAILDNRNRVAPKIEDLCDVPVREVNLVDHDEVAAALKELKPRVVFHMAAIHYIPECNANPERTQRVNVEGTLSLLRACSAAGVEHLLLASSGAVYADSPDALTEQSPALQVDIYGWTKLHAEQLCAWHASMEGLPVTLCRLFNNYGPRETNAHIIPEIIGQLRKSDTLHLGNISPRRDYIHTSDTARALRALAAVPPPRGGVRVVNVASGQHCSVEELILLMGRQLHRKLEVSHDPARFRKADKLVQVAD